LSLNEEEIGDEETSLGLEKYESSLNEEEEDGDNDEVDDS